MAKEKVRIVEREVQRTSYRRRVKQLEKRCPVCGSAFWGAKISRYCSRVCQNKANYGRHAQEYRQARMERYRTERKAAGGKQ